MVEGTRQRYALRLAEWLGIVYIDKSENGNRSMEKRSVT